MIEEPGQSAKPLEPSGVVKKEKLSIEDMEQKLKPRPSLWPIALALAVLITLIGVIIHPILFVVGLVLVVASIIGWGLESTQAQA